MTDPIADSRPLLAFSHAVKFLDALLSAGLISPQGEFLFAKSSDPSVFQKRVAELQEVNWKARGVPDLASYVRKILAEKFAETHEVLGGGRIARP